MNDVYATFDEGMIPRYAELQDKLKALRKQVKEVNQEKKKLEDAMEDIMKQRGEKELSAPNKPDLVVKAKEKVSRRAASKADF